MSKSLKRVITVLEDAGLAIDVLEMPSETRTAQQAADAADCHINQIAKSIIFCGADTGRVILFITAGGNRVDPAKAAQIAGEPLGKADAALIRAQTGFAIGGVAPVGMLNEIPSFWDPNLSEFELIYAAAGTPRHIFSVSPSRLQALSNAIPADFVG
jgi:prolyl-tRNA editing enzyme YbaK/EbsC (Cys-tRNA(Pro) deacylase)